MCLTIILNTNEIKEIKIDNPRNVMGLSPKEKTKVINFAKRKSKGHFVVYKILTKADSRYFSPFKNFQYELGSHYYNYGKSKFTFTFSNGWFHDCITLNVNAGLHAYTSLRKAERCCGRNEVVVKCIIPKGSEYFIDKDDNEIASDNLIVTEEIVYKGLFAR